MVVSSFQPKALNFNQDFKGVSTSPRCLAQQQFITWNVPRRHKTVVSSVISQAWARSAGQRKAASAQGTDIVGELPPAGYGLYASCLRTVTAVLATCLAVQLAAAAPSLALIAAADPDIDTFENVPSQLSSTGERPAVPLSAMVSGPMKREIEACTRKCVPTCIRGGEGAPGLGPISVRKELVVFKEGFRSRRYCLSECAQVCALSLDKDKAAQLLPPSQRGQQQP